MRVQIRNAEGAGIAVEDATRATIFSSSPGKGLLIEHDPFLDKLVLTFHSGEIRQRVNSAGQIEITSGGA